jgi:CheY-like chemotaxis protein
MARPRSILIVDDDVVVAEALAVLLRARGYEVSTAFNGLGGCQRYFNYPTEFVVTDIQMPEMGGFEMMRWIRSVNPRVKAIYLSGALERFESRLRSEARHFSVASLRKPISTKALIDVLSSVEREGQPAT